MSRSTVPPSTASRTRSGAVVARARGARRSARISVLALAGALAACSNAPPVPDWQLSAHGALERAQQAYLVGNTRVADAEYARARQDLASTARSELVARFELARCAARVASLQLDPCSAFDALAADAPPAERVYAAYLAGRSSGAEAALLAEPHRSAVVKGKLEPVDPSTLTQEQSLARLVASAVLVRMGRGDPVVIAAAVELASAQGWRRPLMAWLGVQLNRAEQADDKEAVERLRRRLSLLAPARP